MTRQWIRTLQLDVAGTRIALTGADDARDDLAPRVRFSIEDMTLQSPRVGTFRITNLSENTSSRLLVAKGTAALLCGYKDGGQGLLFSGDIKQVLRGRENPTDTYVDVRAATSDRAYNLAVVNRTLKAGSTPRDIIDVCLAAMKPFGVKAGNIEAALSKIRYPTPVILYGMARDHLRTVAYSNNCNWKLTDGGLDVISTETSLPNNPIILNSQTGLIGLPVQTQLGITARCLIHPGIKLHSLVKIDQRSIQQAPIILSNANGQGVGPLNQEPYLPALSADGVYKVVAINVRGDTYGQEWFMDLTMIRHTGFLNEAQISAGYGIPAQPNVFIGPN